MTTEGASEPKPTMYVFHFAAGELERLNKELPKWQWVDGSKQDGPEKAAALIVFAKRHHEDEAVELCNRFRERKELDETPILLAVNMYQLPFGNKVRRLSKAHFILTPLKAEELEQRLKNLQKSDSGE